jgi:hypothetical protein
VFVAFVNLEKAYDRVIGVNWGKVRRTYGMEMGLIRAVRSIYDGSKACMCEWNTV